MFFGYKIINNIKPVGWAASQWIGLQLELMIGYTTILRLICHNWLIKKYHGTYKNWLNISFTFLYNLTDKPRLPDLVLRFENDVDISSKQKSSGPPCKVDSIIDLKIVIIECCWIITNTNRDVAAIAWSGLKSDNSLTFLELIVLYNFVH